MLARLLMLDYSANGFVRHTLILAFKPLGGRANRVEAPSFAGLQLLIPAETPNGRSHLACHARPTVPRAIRTVERGGPTRTVAA